MNLLCSRWILPYLAMLQNTVETMQPCLGIWHKFVLLFKLQFGFFAVLDLRYTILWSNCSIGCCYCILLSSFFFFQSVLHWSVAVFTICRHSSRVVAFLQVVARPKFRGPRSASIAQSQVWLGLPIGGFQSGGTCRIHAARWTCEVNFFTPCEVNCEQYGRRAADVY